MAVVSVFMPVTTGEIMNIASPYVRALALSLPVLLTACGGSGSGPAPTYTVGGGISGLTAAGLSLSNGADKVTPAAGATSFTFATALASGTTYSVAIATQPTGQTCLLGGASGTVANANVTSVAVSCTTNTYSVGGSISGLTAAGLVLANGADSVSPAAGAATFTLPTKVASGSTYAVTVKTQPAGQTCVVSAGAGTVTTAAVTTVQVSCTTNTYSIGGAISGLTSSGLKLANGADSVSPASGAASFTFATKLPTGSAYSVTVATQPTGLNCSVVSGSGSVAAANVTNVQVNCAPLAAGKHWRAPLMLESASGTALFPLETVDGAGNVMAVWTLNNGNNAVAWASRYSASAATWSTPVAISSLTDSVKQDQELAIAGDAAGNVVAVWAQTAGAINATGVSGIWATRFDAATTSWSAPALIGGNSTPQSVVGIPYMASSPQVAMDSNGNATASWEQNDGQSSVTQNVWAARYVAGSGWSAAQALTNTNDVDGSPKPVGFDAAGNALLLYSVFINNGGSADSRLKAIRYVASSGTWGAPQFLSVDNGNVAYGERLSVSAGGDAIVAWQQSDGTNVNVQANHFSASTTSWGGAQLIDFSAAGGSRDATTAIDAGGTAYVVWVRVPTSGTAHLWERHYASGAWSAAQQVDASPSQGTPTHPQMALDGGGNLMAVWTQQATLVSGGPLIPLIQASYFTGGAWGTQQQLESADGDSDYAQVLLDSSGNGTAVWLKTDVAGINTYIWAARFE
jgi:hypothetical protein